MNGIRSIPTNMNMIQQRLLSSFLLVWLVGSVATTQAQTDTTTIPEAPVVAGFVGVDALSSPRMINVLDLMEVQQTGANAVEDILEFVPGVDVRSRGAFGVQTDLSIRGGTFEQTALWVDGIRWSAPQTGHHLMDLPIDPEDINRVVVSRGGASGLWGAGAMAGSVSLQTGPSLEDGSLLVVESGNNGWMRVKGRVDFGSTLSATSGTLVRHRISVSRAAMRGISAPDTIGIWSTQSPVSNTDAAVFRARYSGWLAGDWGSLKTSLGFADKAFGAQNFYTSLFPVQYEETTTFQGQATYAKTMDDVTLELSAYHRAHGDEFQLFREAPDYYQPDSTGALSLDGVAAGSWYTRPNNHQTLTTGGRLLWRWDNTVGETFVSLDLRREYVQSNLLGNDSLPGVEPNDLFLVSDNRRIVDLAIGRRLEFDRFAIGATAAWNSFANRQTNFVPSLEASYDLTGRGESFVFVSANRSQRHPSFTDLYYTIGGAQGSDSLLSEVAENLEQGLRINLTPNASYKVQFEQALFRRQGTNLIDWAKPDGSDIVYATNLRSVTYEGLEYGLVVRPSTKPATNWFLNYARLGYTTIEADQTSDGFQSNYVLDFVADKVDASVGVEGPDALRFDVRWSWQDRLGEYENRLTGELFEYEPVSLLGLTVSKTFEALKMRSYLRIDNALNKDYVDIGNVQQPGRFVRIGFAYNMN